MLKGADIRGYKSLDSGLRDLAECIKNDEGKHYYLFYYDRIDLISHKYGPGSNEFNSEIEYLLETRNKFRLLFENHGNNLNSENVLLILSSDHGHIQDTGNNVYLNLEFPEIKDCIKRSEDGKLLAPAGSPRAMFLYIKEEKLDVVLKLLQEKLCQKAVVLKTEELLELY